MKEPAIIRRAQSCARDAREAVREFHAAVARPDTALVVFFCSSDYDLEALAEEMRHLFDGIQVVGCTTAGEIGPAGCRDHSLSGMSFPAESFDIVCGQLEQLQQFDIAKGQAFAEALLERLKSQAPQADADNSFALLLIDGSSVREEPVTRSLQSALGHLPLVGGSAGDGLNFGKTYVYFGGRFQTDNAALVLITTPLPFKLFKTQHFVAMDDRLVVTQADSRLRVVNEINGLPAAEEYAHLLGVDARDLDPSRFAAWPVVVMIDGTNYVRSIQKANPDGSLTFFCAIEEGLVLRVARGQNLVNNLEQTFSQIRAEIGQPQLIFASDCILRKLEIAQNGLEDRVGQLFAQNNAVGFNTYGEQYHGVHVNQTLIGVAIGAAPAGGHDA
ncbi:FIST domain containing protein [Oleomonas cavernae]|uniref:FIST domain containing protein n=1 Tax=Oleomonas cavernae TaxID=2320859 RepID=A0A418WA12_9PROT|nr:nitric oxide-sensing protein NosP [Oleomonas cavernae]RJF86852.1 FIST domain containing protein [Oleomonas cavernae]